MEESNPPAREEEEDQDAAVEVVVQVAEAAEDDDDDMSVEHDEEEAVAVVVEETASGADAASDASGEPETRPQDDDDNFDDDDDDDDDDPDDQVEAVAVIDEPAAEADEGVEVEIDADVDLTLLQQEPSEAEEPQPQQPKMKPKPKTPTKKKQKTTMKAASTGKLKEKKRKRDKRRSEAGAQFLSAPGISTERLTAANAARDLLLDAVPRLPVTINEAWIVRNFGHLNVNPKFSTPSALYPVGFSCDRFEFSPVHGRVIKLRCSILDGTKTSLHYEGPVFRVMWGPGVDEDVDRVEYPYYPYTNSAPISSEDDVVAIPAAASSPSNDNFVPSIGMRVKVRFDRAQFFYGSIIDVDTDDDTPVKKKKKKRNVALVIQYDDGSFEETAFPDPDVTLAMPGNDDEMDEDGNVEIMELGGRPVRTAIGRTPIEAWSNCLIKLGLVDEVIVERAKEAVESASLVDAEGRKTSATATTTATPESKKPAKVQSAVEQDAAGDGGEEKDAKPENAAIENKDEVEPVSEEEQDLRDKVSLLLAELEVAKTNDNVAATTLADARIELLGQFMCNPFGDLETDKEHQASWMAAAVRKEKTKMGITGNKRKIVTATDLLERNNTFYNGEIESLVEGLPGSELCDVYQYQATRGTTTASRAWLQEQKLRQEREKQRKLKQSKAAKVKASMERERELKRKKREDERDARKRLKLEEEEEKKKERVKERMSRLEVQINERLYKEASFQREKVVTLMAKNFSKEMNRRRKAAELVAAQVVVEIKPPKTSATATAGLPPLAQRYDEDVLRIWDFISTFGDFFKGKGYVDEVPSLDALQQAIDTLRGTSTGQNKAKAMKFVTALAVSLCKPLSAGSTRTLFASLIALNPILQKEFGAAFFNEINSANSSKEKDDATTETRLDLLLPVDGMTWKEIARIAFIADALGELGYSRQEQAHLIRGYRSAGHPNSKEARRIRRVEDHAIALLRQKLSNNSAEAVQISGGCTVRVDRPSMPSCGREDWKYRLRLVAASELGDVVSTMRDNLLNALDLLHVSESSTFGPEISKCVASLPQEGTLDPSTLMTIKDTILALLERASGGESTSSTVERDADWFLDDTEARLLDKKLKSKLHRSRMGELQTLVLTAHDYKEITRVREEYMSDALRLKEEMKRQELKDAGEDDDDFDGDDDDEEEEHEGGERKQDSTPKADVVEDPMDAGAPGDASKRAKEEQTMDTATATETQESTPSAVGKPEVKTGKVSRYDDYGEDIPSAPELIRRCLAVLRALSRSGPSEPFIYPVDPQTNPGYYDMLARPMCMSEVGLLLKKAAKKYNDIALERQERFLELTVLDFARNVRLIGKNCLSYANAGPMVIAAGSEMLRIFERLLLDWVLAPEEHLPPMHTLDDDLCVDPHPSDVESTVLLCDGCEGNFNISRLNPPLLDIPKGDWFCPRCVSGRWWGDLDPRIGKGFKSSAFSGKITRCFFCHLEDKTEGPSFMYRVDGEDGLKRLVTLEDIDNALKEANDPVPPIRYREAVAESIGYGAGIDHGFRPDLVPVLLNPNVSDAAAQVVLSSTIFRDSIAAASTLLINDPQEMTGAEWLRLLVLLIMKCSASEVMQNVASEMENAAAERMNKRLEEVAKIKDISEVLPTVTDDEAEAETKNEAALTTSAVPAVSVSAGKSEEVTTSAVPAVVTSVEKKEGDVAEASAVEVVEGMVVDTTGTTVDVADVQAETPATESDLFRAQRERTMASKAKRQKAREDSIAAFCIKNQLRPTVASFEEDTVSQVVEEALASKVPGLSFAANRCRGATCDFCGLSDTALGTNLVRVPDEKEWDSMISHCSGSRKTHLIANVGQDKAKPLQKLCIVLGDELVSDDRDDLYFENVSDGGMLEFLPRNPDGFQDELAFRYENDLPFVSGSLSAHEGCAVAAHNSRKVRVVEKFKERQAELVERVEGTSCGRTLELGKDAAGRSYWNFHKDNGSLFVCDNSTTDSEDAASSKWAKYSEPETIASVIACLGKDPMVQELKRTFPQAAAVLKDGSWSNSLMQRAFKISHNPKTQESEEDSTVMEMDVDDEEDEPYEVGEAVLVESRDSRILWDAKVIGISKTPNGGNVNGYRVHYRGWSGVYDEWIAADRVVEPSENNRNVQEEMLEAVALCRDGLPPSLNELNAKKYLRSRDRVRGSIALPNFGKIAETSPHCTEDDVTFKSMKVALLAIEAALPIGSVNNAQNGVWRSSLAKEWRNTVSECDGSWDLMRCVILLEDSINEEWLHEQIGHLRACLPARWKALEEACPSSLALRVLLLDRGLAYDLVDKKRYKVSKSKK